MSQPKRCLLSCSEYMRAVRGVRRRLLGRSAADGLLVVAELGPPAASDDQQKAAAAEKGKQETGGSVKETGSSRRPKTPKMDHLVCFLPGTLALGHLHGIKTGDFKPRNSRV